MTTKKVTTLQSATGVSSPIMIECRDDVVHFTAWTSAETNRAWANPKRADVLAALGIDELGCGCDEADTNLKKALARAEDAEAFGAAAVKRAEEAEAEALEQAKLVRTWADRAEKAESEHEATKKAYRDLGANHAKLMERLAEAEATIERVKALASEWLLMGRITREKGAQLSAALTPPTPPFALPIKPGVRFKATDNCSKPCVFLSVWNGPDIAFVNERTSVIWDGENVLKYCTGHRLIEAES